MRKLTVILLLVTTSAIISIFVYSCSGSTMITGTWNKKDITKKYSHILVASLSGNVHVKSVIEQSLARNLRDKGLTVFMSIDKMPPKFIDDKNQKQQLLENIRGNNIDAILTVSLIDKKTETRYVPGSYSYAPYPSFIYYGTFWGYYDYWYPRFETPGYYTQDNIYFIETNLYDSKTEELIWSAQSKTYNPDNLQSFAEEFAKSITDRLVKENIIQKSNNLSGF